MKQGKTDIVSLAKEIHRQKEAKRDFVADTRAVTAVPIDPPTEEIENPQRDVELSFATNGSETQFPLSPIAHRQVANRVGIPAKYYERLRNDHPDLLANQLTELFQREPERRMLRTLDGDVRAFLSDRYRPLDNDELLEAVLPVLSELQVEIQSTEVTERRMYLKFTTPKLEREVVPGLGDVIRAGGVISNSEVGLGTMRIADLDYRLVCLNGMVRETVAKQTHVGRHTGIEGIDASEFFKDETREADDKALFLKLRDTVSAMFSKERFEARIAQYAQAKTHAIEKPVEVVEVVAKRFALPDGQRQGVLEALLRDGDYSKWGLANAVTRASQDVEEYDTASDLEVLGGKIIELPARDFDGINKAAALLADKR